MRDTDAEALRPISKQLIVTYGSTRFAIYDTAKERASANNATPSPLALLSMAAFSGFCGGIVGNPADICNVKMQNERSLPPEARQNYRSVFDVLRRIGKEQGPRGYFRGLWPNCLRAAGMTGFQLASYDYCKRVLVENLHRNDDLVTQFVSSIFASLVATTICNPIDVIKTQTMSSSKQTSGMLSTVKQLTKTEGLAWMWRGWLPSFARLGPHTVATLVILEQHRLVYRRYRKWKQETAV
jgi:dicarboxylate transporter 10